LIKWGLERWEAVERGFEVEEIEPPKKRRPVADYVRERKDAAPDGKEWQEWLQTHRIELNAMTTPQFIAWLDGKLADYDKLIPPEDVLEAELEEKLEQSARAVITERILREANVEGQVAEALAAINRPTGVIIAKGIRRMFGRSPESEWREHVTAIVKALVKKV